MIRNPLSRASIRWALVLLVLVSGAFATPAAALDYQQDSSTTTPTPTTPTPVAENNSTNSTYRYGETPDSGRPDAASRARITPVEFSEPFLTVETTQRDEAFNTTGPFVVLDVDEPLEAARISQPKASADVLAGGQQVRVEYDDDAAGDSEASLYTLELFFTDGSSTNVSLYAQKTDVSVAAARLEDKEPVLAELCEDAEAKGYECTNEGMENYLDFIQERADLIDSWLGQKAMQALAIIVAAGTNPILWAVVLGLLVLAGKFLAGKYGGILDIVNNDPGKARRTIDQLKSANERQVQTANEESLRDVPAIGSDAVYWEDGLGTFSPAQLANLAARGHVKRDETGETQVVHYGVEDLTVESLRNGKSWLEPVHRNGNMTVVQALGQVKSVCEYMGSQYGQSHRYGEAAQRLEVLIDNVKLESGVGGSLPSTTGRAGGVPSDD
ncbi:hypothetical protein [Halomarina oriensis]|uniref:Uncharacterized protein n=1 Tax=Halomarina oriensis TaxID=671145 RepID=A0A6B0GRH3_9EURY|nr:hypothetical protein [Halomarina oriensis]MWG36229.1 hypothetical protein [Halomarina oriensis]